MAKKRKNKLTPLKVINAKPTDKIQRLSDGDGLNLKITPSGAKIWERYFNDPISGKRTTMSFGSADDITLKEVREQNKEATELIKQGINPIKERQNKKAKVEKEKELKTKLTFKIIFDEWINLDLGLSDDTKRNKIRETNTYIFPFIGNKELEKISQKEIADLLINSNKTAPSRSKKLKGIIRAVWAYAITNGYFIGQNPIDNMDTKTLFKPHRSLNIKAIVDEDKFEILVNRIYSMPNSSIGNALRFVLHIPLRNDNLINLRWDNFDFKAKELIIPRAEMKIKNKNFRDFIIPLSDEVMRILMKHKELYGGFEYVFISGINSNKTISNQGLNSSLARMGFTAKNGLKQTTHSFRSTFSTLANEHIKEIDIKDNRPIERFLDHKTGTEVETIYNRSNYLDGLTEVAKWWSDFILSKVEK